MTCSAKSSKKKFLVKAWVDHEKIPFEDTKASNAKSVLHTIKLQPIVKLRNLVPYDMKYSIQDIDETYMLKSGDESDLPSVRLGETGIELRLCDYLERDWFCHQVFPSFGEEKEFFIWSFTPSSVNQNNRHVVDLAVTLTLEGSSLVVTIYSPFWMINKTSQELTYKVDDDRQIVHPSVFNSPVLLCFKPKKFFSKKKLSLAINDSCLSDDFSIDVVGSNGNIITKSKNGKKNSRSPKDKWPLWKKQIK